MRIGVLDVGSNSAHLKVTDLRVGAPPDLVTTVKHPTRLAEAINADGEVEREAMERLIVSVGEAVRAAASHGVEELASFATSAVRDATNQQEIVSRVEAATGVRLGFLSGRDEARLTFLAARAWYGWSAGRLLLADIGGGSLEIAHGDGQEPVLALSLPLGAGRLTRAHLPGDPPSRKQLKRLRRRVYERLDEASAQVKPGLAGERQVRPVATSKTFTQLARLTGAPKRKVGPYARRVLELERLREQIPVLAAKRASARAKLQGISRPRAPQILAGAIVAEALMTILEIDRVDICPWAIREGLIMRRLQAMSDPAAADDETARLTQAVPAARIRAPLTPVPPLTA